MYTQGSFEFYTAKSRDFLIPPSSSFIGFDYLREISIDYMSMVYIHVGNNMMFDAIIVVTIFLIASVRRIKLPVYM